VPDYVALDLHRDYVHRCQLEPHPEGAKMRHSRFPNTREGWARFIETETGPQTWVAFEVTGNAFEVWDLLSPHVGRVLVAKASAAKEKGSGRKTDRADTERLVLGLAQGTLPAVWVPPKEVRDLRHLLQARRRTDSRRKAVGNQLRAILRRNWIQVPTGTDVQAWIAAHPEALDELGPADRILALSALRQYEVLAQEVAALTAEVAARTEKEPRVQLLLSIPGVSLITAAHIYAYLGDPSRFPGPKQLTRYAGLDPSVHSSGERNRRGRTSKNGCKPLRTALIEAAHTVARYDTGPLGQFFARMRKKAGYHKSIVALARKLLIVAWRILLTGTSYHGARLETTQRKVRHLERQAARSRDWTVLRVQLLGGDTGDGVAAPGQTSQRRRAPRKRTPVPA